MTDDGGGTGGQAGEAGQPPASSRFCGPAGRGLPRSALRVALAGRDGTGRPGPHADASHPRASWAEPSPSVSLPCLPLCWPLASAPLSVLGPPATPLTRHSTVTFRTSVGGPSNAVNLWLRRPQPEGSFCFQRPLGQHRAPAGRAPCPGVGCAIQLSSAATSQAPGAGE